MFPSRLGERSQKGTYMPRRGRKSTGGLSAFASNGSRPALRTTGVLECGLSILLAAPHSHLPLDAFRRVCSRGASNGLRAGLCHRIPVVESSSNRFTQAAAASCRYQVTPHLSVVVHPIRELCPSFLIKPTPTPQHHWQCPVLSSQGTPPCTVPFSPDFPLDRNPQPVRSNPQLSPSEPMLAICASLFFVLAQFTSPNTAVSTAAFAPASCLILCECAHPIFLQADI
ncbi:hypothetical protein B0T17DRAFT_64348 [Bombardia bombarda]|uniref:Uncharacterized protein n=1 Tax=Bombardia bombarda TaxID=252184 RepID=A0AA39XKY5_9PEZI|nr:hypothetical protein B0T17DRAFT_64348 [Bombardia bombarda]